MNSDDFLTEFPSIYTIFDRPDDFPLHVVVRRFPYIDGHIVPEPRLWSLTNSLDEARASIPHNYVRRPPDKLDHPKIVEVWLHPELHRLLMEAGQMNLPRDYEPNETDRFFVVLKDNQLQTFSVVNFETYRNLWNTGQLVMGGPYDERVAAFFRSQDMKEETM